MLLTKLKPAYRSLLNFSKAFAKSTVAENRWYDFPVVSLSGGLSVLDEALAGPPEFKTSRRNCSTVFFTSTEKNSHSLSFGKT